MFYRPEGLSFARMLADSGLDPALDLSCGKSPVPVPSPCGSRRVSRGKECVAYPPGSTRDGKVRLLGWLPPNETHEIRRCDLRRECFLVRQCETALAPAVVGTATFTCGSPRVTSA